MKTLVLVILLVSVLVLPAFASITYTATPGETGGSYGSTGIPTVYYDETGSQLFDGDYGKWDWIIRQQPSTLDQYQAHYNDQKGYAYPWVCWTNPSTITIDNSIEQYTQLGLHMYRGREIGVPDSVIINFSSDGINYGGDISYNLYEKYNNYNDSVFWVSFNFPAINARYAKIYMFPGGGWKFVDEMSINGVDGAGNPVPEPSSLIVLGTLLTPLLLFRRRR